MELAGVVGIQVIVIFLLISVGFILVKFKMLNEEGVKQITALLLNIVTPCVLINSYQKEMQPDLVKGLLIALGLSLVSNLISILISTLVFSKQEDGKRKINIFSASYSNCGFMAIPLLTAALGSDGVFYGSAYLVIFTILSWTHGLVLCSGDKKVISLKNIVKNPGIIGVFLAMVVFVFGIKLPAPLKSAVEYMSYLNTPLAMIILGSYLTKVNFKKVLLNINLYIVSLLRLIISPLITVGILALIKINPTVASAIIITASCPTATITTLFAARYNLEADYASELVSLTTLLSIVTIPLILLISEMVV